MIDGCNTVGQPSEDTNGILYKTAYLAEKSKEAIIQPVIETKAATISSNELIVYPNPFKNNIIIGYTLGEKANVTVRLLNTNGQVLKTILSPTIHKKGTYQLRLNMPELLGGLLFNTI